MAIPPQWFEDHVPLCIDILSTGNLPFSD
uniref:Uncharacterized protein n=1 Tax=Arundo donax TaxID=35708 RepID=A0A0A8YQ33_ARUDO